MSIVSWNSPAGHTDPLCPSVTFSPNDTVLGDHPHQLDIRVRVTEQPRNHRTYVGVGDDSARRRGLGTAILDRRNRRQRACIRAPAACSPSTASPGRQRCAGFEQLVGTTRHPETWVAARLVRLGGATN